MVSELNANKPDEFGPYESYELAIAGLQRVMEKTRKNEPSIIRTFTPPYKGSNRPEKQEDGE